MREEHGPPGHDREPAVESRSVAATAAQAHVPPVPGRWTPEVARALLPVRLGRGWTIRLHRDQLVLATADWKVPYSAAPTAAGWIAVWAEARKHLRLGDLAKGRLHYLEDAAALGRSRHPAVLRDARAAALFDEQMPAVLAEVIYTGGQGASGGLRRGDGVDLRLRGDELVIVTPGDSEVTHAVALADLTEVSVTGQSPSGGPFVTTTAHGTVAGLAPLGTGESASAHLAEPVASIIRLVAPGCELHFWAPGIATQAAELACAPLRRAAPAAPASVSSAAPGAGSPQLRAARRPAPDRGRRS